NTNIIYNQSGINLIDWDSLGIRPYVFEVISSACFLCREGRGEFKINKDKLKRYIKSFKLSGIEKQKICNMIFIIFVPRKSKSEQFFVSGQNKLEWYFEWSINAMKECLFGFNKAFK